MIAAVPTTGSGKHEYCIVGSGPGGVQLAMFMERGGDDYVVLEKGPKSGMFFDKYPRHRQLISINKVYTGNGNTENNLRHDWNSLIVDDDSMLFKHWSQEYFPHADNMTTYLNAVSHHYGIDKKTMYSTEVKRVSRLGEGFKLELGVAAGKATLECAKVVMATGFSVTNKADIDKPEGFYGKMQLAGEELIEDYSTMSIDPKNFTNQSVLILGKKNAAFETANNLQATAASIHMVSRSRLKMAYETHYVGDLRAINYAILDQYQVAAPLDSFIEGDVTKMKFVRGADGKIHVESIDANWTIPAHHPLSKPYDRVLRCIGWSFDYSIFDDDVKPIPNPMVAKFPLQNEWYESENVPRLYFVGTLMHSKDFRKSSGGFVHGFRYLARALYNALNFRYKQTPWPVGEDISTDITPLSVAHTILRRTNEASGPYQMFNVLQDLVLVFKPPSEVDAIRPNPSKWEIVTLHEVPKWLTFQVARAITRDGKVLAQVYVVNLEYGPNFSGPGRDVTGPSRARSEVREAALSNFLHPVIYCHAIQPKTEESCGSAHLLEDFHVHWYDDRVHVTPLKTFLTATFNGFRSEQLRPDPEAEMHCLDVDKYPTIDARFACVEALKKQVEAWRNGLADDYAKMKKLAPWIDDAWELIKKEQEAKARLDQKRQKVELLKQKFEGFQRFKKMLDDKHTHHEHDLSDK